jgi:hypothetical protein
MGIRVERRHRGIEITTASYIHYHPYRPHRPGHSIAIHAHSPTRNIPRSTIGIEQRHPFLGLLLITAHTTPLSSIFPFFLSYAFSRRNIPTAALHNDEPIQASADQKQSGTNGAHGTGGSDDGICSGGRKGRGEGKRRDLVV